MPPPKVQYAQLTALIVDDHVSQRQQLRWHLTQLGIERVDQAGTALEALNQLSRRTYDLVLCDFNLDTNSRGIVSNGQQLLEHVRTVGVLAPTTIFIMVSGNNSYKDIAATVEFKPDAYLVKPITTKTLEERLQRLLERQIALDPITAKGRTGDKAGAVAAADQVMAQHPEYTLNALQLKGNFQLELAAFGDALATFERVLAISARLDWAFLGKARALKGLGQAAQARQVLQDLIGRNNLYTSAYDLLARMAEEEGDDAEALRVLQLSLKEIPSPSRSRSLAETAYRAGDVETARVNYEAVLKATKGTFVAQSADVLMLVQSVIDTGDHTEALKLLTANMKEVTQDSGLAGAAYGLQAQAYAGTGDMAAAAQSAHLAKAKAGSASTPINSMLLAKGLLAVGDDSGLEILKSVVRSDHDNARVLGLARKVLKDSGQEAMVEAIVTASADAVRDTLAGALRLRREGKFEQAKELVDLALAELPNNTSVLLEAAQVYLLTLMRQERKDSTMVTQVEGFLQRLEALLPGNDRVSAQRAYFRKVMSS